MCRHVCLLFNMMQLNGNNQTNQKVLVLYFTVLYVFVVRLTERSTKLNSSFLNAFDLWSELSLGLIGGAAGI